MSDTMLARRRLRLAVRAVIESLIGVTVDSPGALDTEPDKLPNIKLRAPLERKISGGRTMPNFTTTATLEMLVRVGGDDEEDAQDRLEDLCYRVEQAVLAAPAFIRWLQQVASITTTTRITAAGKGHLGEAEMSVDCEFFETFDPVLIDPDSYPELQRLLLTIDTVQPFDRTGTYPAPAFPDAVVPAPRAQGPDGRAEGGLDLTLSP